MSIKSDSVTKMTADVTQMEYRGRVFSGQGIQSADVRVDEDGSVTVWDSIAGYYTLCHSISNYGQRQIRKAAEA